MRFSSTIYESLRNISSRRAGWGCRRPVRLLDRWLQAFTWRHCQHWRHRTNGPKSGCKRKDATPSALQVLQTSAEVADMPWAWDTSIVIIRTCIQCTSKARHHQIDTVVVLIRQWNPYLSLSREWHLPQISNNDADGCLCGDALDQHFRHCLWCRKAWFGVMCVIDDVSSPQEVACI